MGRLEPPAAGLAVPALVYLFIARSDPAALHAHNLSAADVTTATNLSVDAFVATVQMESSGALTATQAKTVLKELLESGGDPVAIADGEPFAPPWQYVQLSVSTLSAVVHRGGNTRGEPPLPSLWHEETEHCP